MQYVGIDVVPDALKRASEAMIAATTEWQHARTSPTPFVTKVMGASRFRSAPSPFPTTDLTGLSLI